MKYDGPPISIATILVAVFLILFGINAAGMVAVSGTLLGIIAVIAGVLLLAKALQPHIGG